MTMTYDLSIIIPVYNEEKRIPKSIGKIFTHLKNLPLSTEVIFVNDGSCDGTETLLRNHKNQRSFRLVSYARNRGKGYAVREGIRAAEGRWIVFLDIDLATPLTELDRLSRLIKGETKSAPVIMGNRRMRGASVKRSEPLLRVVLGKGFSLLSRFFVWEVTDFTCGFKCFRRDAAKRIFGAARIDRWAFDTEIIYLAKRFEYPILQVPVEWAHDEESRVRVLCDVARSLTELFLIAWYAVSGEYGAYASPRYRAHARAVAASLAMAFLVAAPLVAFPYYAGSAYRGINIAHFGDDEHLYLSRGKEALEGHGLGQAFLAEGKDAPDPTFSYAERVLLAPVTLSGVGDRVDIVTYYNVANALGVFALILLIYAFAFALSGDSLFSIGAAVFAVGGYSIIYNKTLFYHDFNIYGRSLWPWMSSAPFFAFLLVLYRGIEKDDARLALGAGILAGFLCYVYFYAWTFAFAVLGSLAVAFFVLGDWRALRHTAVAAALAAALGAPVFFGLARFFGSDASRQVAYFLFASHGRAPVFSLIGSATLALFIVWAYRARAALRGAFLFALIAAGWIALNQQVLTGRFVQYGHYYWYFIVPISIVIGAYMAWELLPRRYRVLLPTALVVLAFVNTSVGQYRSFPTTVPGKLREQDFAPLLSRLRHAPVGAVFMGSSGDTYPFLVTIYTRDDLYWIPAAELFPFPHGRLEEALLLHLYMDARSRHRPAAFLSRELGAGTKDAYTSMYADLEGWRSGLDYYMYQKRAAGASEDTSLAPLRASLMRELSERYRREFDSPASARKLLRERGVAYILWDKRQYPDWDIAPLAPLALIATSTDLALYRFD